MEMTRVRRMYALPRKSIAGYPALTTVPLRFSASFYWMVWLLPDLVSSRSLYPYENVRQLDLLMWLMLYVVEDTPGGTN